jgi:hypothetical protein
MRDDLEGRVIVGDGAVVLLDLEIRPAAAIVVPSVARFEADRLAVVGHRFALPAHPELDIGSLEVTTGELGIDADIGKSILSRNSLNPPVGRFPATCSRGSRDVPFDHAVV